MLAVVVVINVTITVSVNTNGLLVNGKFRIP